MRIKLVGTWAVVLTAAVGLCLGARDAEANKKSKFKVHFDYRVSNDPDPEHRFLDFASVEEVVIDGTPGIAVSTFFNLSANGMGAPYVWFLLPKIDYAAQTYPLDVDVRNLELNLCNSSGTGVRGVWAQNGATPLRVTLTGYDAKKRGISGTFDFAQIPFVGGGPSPAPVTLSGGFSVILPNYDADPNRISFTSSNAPQVEFRFSTPKKTKFPLFTRSKTYGTITVRVYELYRVDRRIGAPRLSFRFDVADFANLTYPVTVPSGGSFEAYAYGCDETIYGTRYGSWDTSENLDPVITLTGYDQATKQLSGTFSFGPMAGTDFDGDPVPSTTVSGSFTMLVPKKK